MQYVIMLVREDDPAISARWVTIDREGDGMPAYYAEPRGANETTPSVVLAMHLYGVDEHQRDVARRFAKAGFSAVIPNLYARFDAPSGEGATDPKPFIPFARKLTGETVDPDIRASASWLKERMPRAKTAIAGFCMGGVIALRRTAGYSDLFAAAAVWYGAIMPDYDPQRVDIPIVGSYGADDTGIPVESVEALRSNMRVPNDIVIYPHAGHAFFDDTRETHEPKAAEDSWHRTLTFLRNYL